jgi:hypothetical protein
MGAGAGVDAETGYAFAIVETALRHSCEVWRMGKTKCLHLVVDKT